MRIRERTCERTNRSATTRTCAKRTTIAKGEERARSRKYRAFFLIPLFERGLPLAQRLARRMRRPKHTTKPLKSTRKSPHVREIAKEISSDRGVRLASSGEYAISNNATLARFGEPNGGIGIWSLTFQPIIHLAPRAAGVRPYVTGGYGLYHYNFTLSHPAAAPTIFCGLFGCFPTLVGVNALVTSTSTYRSGFNAGFGFDFPIHSDSQASFFLEARYNQMFMGHNMDAQYVPVTFGFRW